MRNIKLFLGALTLSVTMFASGAVFTQAANANMMTTQIALRGEQASAANLIAVRSRLDTVIDNLQRDRHDYGGHRVAAIAFLQKARVELQLAINYDATHRH